MTYQKTLCIIGNGFDLYHWGERNPNTSYGSFKIFLEKNEQDIHDALSKFFPLRENWNNFETALSELDTEGIWDDLINYMDDSDPHRYGEASWEAQRYVELLTTKMPKALQIFIHGEAHERGGIKYPQNIDGKQIQLPQNALYLSFNYTNTLERYYGIPESRICYLHGKSGRTESLIIGHGIDPTTLGNSEPPPVMPNNLSPEEEEEWSDYMSSQYSPSAELAEHELEEYWRASFKDTQSIIDSNKSFFQQYERVDKVSIMGHSLSEVDLPYFEEIKKRVSSNVCWDISFHTDDEKENLKRAVIGLGVSEERVTLFKLGDVKYK